MRGEHSCAKATAGLSKGSSPHARGALEDCVPADSGAGIIPACAGSTAQSRVARRRLEDHPRMRGEHGLSTTTHPSG